MAYLLIFKFAIMDLVISELTPGGSTTPGLNPESTNQFQLWIWLCVILHICDVSVKTSENWHLMMQKMIVFSTLSLFSIKNVQLL